MRIQNVVETKKKRVKGLSPFLANILVDRDERGQHNKD